MHGILISNGIYVKFKATTGHHIGDFWLFYGGDGVWLGDRMIYFYQDVPGGHVDPCFAWYWFHTGTSTQTVDTNLQAEVPEYSNPHKNTAYIVLKLRYLFSDSTTLWQGAPEIKLTLKGRKLYDPRNSTTVYSTNGALVWRDFLTNGRYGLGLLTTKVNDTALGIAATWCTTNSFTFNGAIIDREKGLDILDDIEKNFRGYRVESDGLQKLCIWDYDASVMTFTEFDNEVDIDPASFRIDMGMQDRFNRVKCTFINPNKNWATDFQKYEDEAQITLDGILKELEIELIGTTNPVQALKLAKFWYYRHKYSQGIASLLIQKSSRESLGICLP